MMITIDDGNVRRDIAKMRDSLSGAAQEAGRAQMKALLEKLKERVIEMIPDEGGWHDLYKDSIEVNKLSDDHYELTTTIAEIQYGNILAETSLIWLSGSDPAAQVLSQFNPWTLDTIPALDGDGLTANLLVRPGSEREVNTFRTRRLGDQTEITRRLKVINRKVLKFDATLGEVNGRVLADVPFLAKRLEYGLGGFPRVAIWTRINREGELLSEDNAVKMAGENVFASRWWKTRKGNVGR